MAEQPPRIVAMYWHLEDLVASTYDHVHGTGAWEFDGVAVAADRADGSKVGRARIDIPKLLRYAQPLGTVAINRYYADWTRGVFVDYRRSATQRPPVEFVQVHGDAPLPVSVRLPADVVSDLRRNPRVTDVLVCTGTEGFYALPQLCRETGRRLHVIGTASPQTATAREGFTFTNYAQVVPLRREPVPPWVVLIRAAFEGDLSGQINIGTLKSRMRAIDASFSETTYGFKATGGFKPFLLHAQGLGFVHVEDNGGSDIRVRLASSSAAAGTGS